MENSKKQALAVENLWHSYNKRPAIIAMGYECRVNYSACGGRLLKVLIAAKAVKLPRQGYISNHAVTPYVESQNIHCATSGLWLPFALPLAL